jgi:hypothetical protein
MMNSFRTLVLHLRTFRPCASEPLRMLRKSLPLGVRVARMTSAHELAQGGNVRFAPKATEFLRCRELT